MKKTENLKQDLVSEEKFRQKEAAQLLGISLSKLSRLTSAKKIGCYRLSSGVVLYSNQHLQDFLSKSEQKVGL